MITAHKRKAFVFDLDCTINHAVPIAGGLTIHGRTTNSLINRSVLTVLKKISEHLTLFVATGRSLDTVADFKTHFANAGIEISGWILEHGTVVEGYPGWTENVLNSVNLSTIHSKAKAIIREHQLPIDTEYYKNNHQGFLLYTGENKVSSEYFLSQLSGLLGSHFRTIVGKRKISIIPKTGDKYLAFKEIFGGEYDIVFAAGDAPDDLSLLQAASFPLTLSDASPLVQEYVRRRGGFISTHINHAGTINILETILYRIIHSKGGLVVLGARLPYEEIGIFRKSRCDFLENLFHIAKYPRNKPDLLTINQLSKNLDFGKNTIIEIRMRDWGGEIKPLRNVLKVLIALLPYARYRLIFRPERLGIENLKDFKNISDKLECFQSLSDGIPRFSAPGVPNSPEMIQQSSLTLFLYDHPEDLEPWYDYSIPSLITKHPKRENTFFINPMFLKIADLFNMLDYFSKTEPPVKMCGPRVMMAANIVDEKDIRIAIGGFQKLSHYLDALIIAPRVINNISRNQMISEAVCSLGEELVCFSKLKDGDRPKILFVDTYGDLSKLYNSCMLTYLGGGYDSRKRGFDPMESLIARVPVVLGPIFDYNRIAVDSLSNSGWISILADESTAVDDFVRIAKERILSKPEFVVLEEFLLERQLDPLRVADNLLQALSKK
jgi:hydroxymethylpyrimidine pyrophosphatase-like HAD family hydrolase